MAWVVSLFVQQTVAPHALSEPMSEIVFGLGYGTLPIPLELRWFATDIDHIHPTHDRLRTY